MWGFPNFGVPYWGPHYKGIPLFGDLYWGSLLFVNPDMAEDPDYSDHDCSYNLTDL